MSAASQGRLIAAARAGDRLAYDGSFPSRELAEEMLAVPTAMLRDADERNEAIAALDLDGALAQLEHEWLGHRGVAIHLEHHRAAEVAPTAVIAPGLGDHTRRHTGLAAALHADGFNVIGIDRQGHGLSEGHRGDATLEEDLAVLELAIRTARDRSSGPVVVIGDSLGGIMTWYLLTREPDIDAAVCHCIAHPEIRHDAAFRLKAPLMKAAARIAPRAAISVRQIADYEHVALDPETKRYFDEQLDRLFNFTVTARSVASYIGFEPALPWEHVQTPVLVVIGAADRMVTPAFTREAFARATPPNAEYREFEGAGHQLFLDHLDSTLEPILGWLHATLEPGAVRRGH